MRLMITFSFPTESGNAVVGSGKIGKIFEKLMADLQPEAAYFYPEGGARGGVFFVNGKESADVARLAEPLWFGLGAHVTMTPVMSGDDLTKALADLPKIAARYK